MGFGLLPPASADVLQPPSSPAAAFTFSPAQKLGMSKAAVRKSALANTAVFSFAKAVKVEGDCEGRPVPRPFSLAAAFVFSPAQKLGVSKAAAGKAGPAGSVGMFSFAKAPPIIMPPADTASAGACNANAINGGLTDIPTDSSVGAFGSFRANGSAAPRVATTPGTPAVAFGAPVGVKPLAPSGFLPTPPVAARASASATFSSPFSMSPAKNLGVTKAAAVAVPPALVGAEAFSFAKATPAGSQAAGAGGGASTSTVTDEVPLARLAPALSAPIGKPPRPFRPDDSSAPALAFSPTPASQGAPTKSPPTGRANPTAPFQAAASAAEASSFSFSPAKPVGASKAALASAAAGRGGASATPGGFSFARGSPIPSGPSATAGCTRKRATVTTPAPAAAPAAVIPEGSEVVHVRNAGSAASNGDYVPTAMQSGAGRPLYSKVGGEEALYWDAEFGGRWRLYAGDGSGLYSCYTTSDTVPTARWKVGAFGADPAPTVVVTPSARAGASGPPAAKKAKVSATVPPEEPYAEQLKKLKDMGLGGYGDELLTEMLISANGSVGGVVTTLLG